MYFVCVCVINVFHLTLFYVIIVAEKGIAYITELVIGQFNKDNERIIATKLV